MRDEQFPGQADEPDQTVHYISKVISTMGGSMSAPDHQGATAPTDAAPENAPRAEMAQLMRAIDHGADQNFDVWVRNLWGASPALQDIIRERAECAAREGRPLEVLQIGQGMPFAVLSFHGDKIVQAGDYLREGPHGSHNPPKVRSTAIVEQDYVTQFLTSNEAVTSSELMSETYTAKLLGQIVSAPTGYEESNARIKAMVHEKYRAMEEQGDITTVVQRNPTAALHELLRNGARYDIILADLSTVDDKENCLRVMQACLTRGGRAMIPLEWWLPSPRGSGTIRSKLIPDTVPVEGGEVPLGEYLAQTEPESFEVIQYPGANTLCLAGFND